MQTRTGTYLATQRQAKHLTLGQLARAVGYGNVEKGSRRIQQLEREGRTIDGLLEKICVVLDLDPAHVWSLVEQDRLEFEEAWRAWVNEPVEPRLRVRLIPAVWGRAKLPAGSSREGAVQYARSRAVEHRKVHVLVWNRAEEIWCYEDGRSTVVTMKVGEAAGPFTRPRGRGGSGFLFG